MTCYRPVLKSGIALEATMELKSLALILPRIFFPDLRVCQHLDE